MKKYLTPLLIITIISTNYCTAQVNIGSQIGVSINLNQEIAFDDPSGTITLKDVTIETTDNIRFLKTKIILINSKIKCRDLDLTNITEISISETVNVSCDILKLPTIVVPLTSQNRSAKLNVVYKTNVVNPNNYSIPAQTGISVKVKKEI